MRIGMRAVAAAFVLLVGTAFADPFTGRYNIESTPNANASVTGFIDFLNAPMGTTSFKLSDSFVTGFSIVGTTPLFATLTYDDITDVHLDDTITFSMALGAPVLTPVLGGDWSGRGDLDGLANFDDLLNLAINGFYQLQSGIGPGSSRSVIGQSWRLALAAGTHPVPEPGTLVLTGLAVAGALVWRRRKRKA